MYLLDIVGLVVLLLLLGLVVVVSVAAHRCL